MKVAAHAISDAEALRAANTGADVLAHTPVEALSEATLSAWSNKVIVSTLAAFGGETASQQPAPAPAARSVVLLRHRLRQPAEQPRSAKKKSLSSFRPGSIQRR